MLQLLLFEVRKFEKIEGIAYLEGRGFKSNKCGIPRIKIQENMTRSLYIETLTCTSLILEKL